MQDALHALGPLAVAVGIFLLCAFARFLRHALLTLPIAALALGYALSLAVGDAMVENTLLERVAEATLVLALFTDASRIAPRALKASAAWSLRILLVGMTLALGLGTLVAWSILGWPFWQVALLAALMVPTDAALASSVIENDAVPAHLRETLTVESGLNDGLALPAVLFTGCAAVGFAHDLGQGNWLVFATTQVFYGLGVGITAGALGGLVLRWTDGDRASVAGRAAATLAVPAVAWFGAEYVAGNGFVAAFVAGLAFAAVRRTASGTQEFLHTEGLLLTLIAFVFIGLVLVPAAVAGFRWEWLLVVFLMLFVVRPVAVWLALVGSDARPRERLFLGWFGPRGLATALFALFVLDEFMKLPHGPSILGIATLAVVASAVLHGATSHFAGRWSAAPEA